MAMQAPPSAPLYQRDESLRTHTTTVLTISSVADIAEADQLLFKQALKTGFVVTTAETIFYAQGGGQPCDTGSMSFPASAEGGGSTVFQISSVRNGSGGQILHLGEFVPPDTRFSPGTVVFQAIDGAKRDHNSRIHTGGHIVGLAVRHLISSIPDVTELKAQHYPDLAFVDFQGTIESKHKDAIEAKANEFVSQALPVKVYWWNKHELREKCAVVPAAVVIPEGELVRAVDIEGAGAYPCGGTHVPDTSKVGRVTIKRISRSKGNSKISYAIV